MVGRMWLVSNQVNCSGKTTCAQCLSRLHTCLTSPDDDDGTHVEFSCSLIAGNLAITLVFLANAQPNLPAWHLL